MQGSLFHFARNVIFAAFALLTAVFGQQQTTEPSNPFPPGNNQWHLGYSVKSFDNTGVFHTVAGHQMGDQSANNPMEVNDTFTNPDPQNTKVVLLNPPVDCVNTGPASTNACVFTSSSAQQVDGNKIRYSYRNWGGRCVMSVRVMEYAATVKWTWASLAPWSTGSPFIVVVPEEAVDGTPEVFGKLNGANIYFSPSDPLSATDAQHFKLLEPKKFVPGLGTIYRFEAR